MVFFDGDMIQFCISGHTHLPSALVGLTLSGARRSDLNPIQTVAGAGHGTEHGATGLFYIDLAPFTACVYGTKVGR